MAASAAGADIASDLASLREDIAKLGKQVSEIMAERGNAAWWKAKSNC
jgi:hypothetical protein